MTDREEAAFDAAAATVTCLINSDRDEARRIAYSTDHLHEAMILILAEVIANEHTADSWQRALLAARAQG